MERWYLPINCHSRGRVEKYTERIINELSRYIRTNQLNNLVPVIFLEEKPQRDFYLFMGIESEHKPEIPEILKLFVPLIGRPLIEPLDFDQIKSMVSGPVTPLDYARRIKYREQLTTPQDDPFDFYEEDFSRREASTGEELALSENYNQLLYWLSMVGNGTWQTFKTACKSLGLDPTGTESRRILRRLRLLGHLEVSRDGTHWAACPSCLIAIEAESQQEHILSGQQSVQLLKEIENIKGVTLQTIKQPEAQAPASIRLQTDSESDLDKLIAKVGSHFAINYADKVAYKLAEILPSLAEWKGTLTHVGRFLPALYEIERFSKGSFEHSFQGESGMYRLHPRDRNNQVSRTLFYNQGSDQWLQGDWYGLRFLALREENTECKAVYHIKARRLALPVSQRWPDLYERALVLCSGQLADQQNGWLFFDEVPREIALKLTHKLTVSYEEVS